MLNTSVKPIYAPFVMIYEGKFVIVARHESHDIRSGLRHAVDAMFVFPSVAPDTCNISYRRLLLCPPVDASERECGM